MNRLKVVFRQQMKGAKSLIILEIKALSSLEVLDVCIECRVLLGLLGALLGANHVVLAMGVLRRGHALTAARATVVMVVVMAGHAVGVSMSDVVEAGHDCVGVL